MVTMLSSGGISPDRVSNDVFSWIPYPAYEDIVFGFNELIKEFCCLSVMDPYRIRS